MSDDRLEIEFIVHVDESKRKVDEVTTLFRKQDNALKSLTEQSKILGRDYKETAEKARQGIESLFSTTSKINKSTKNATEQARRDIEALFSTSAKLGGVARQQSGVWSKAAKSLSHEVHNAKNSWVEAAKLIDTAQADAVKGSDEVAAKTEIAGKRQVKATEQTTKSVKKTKKEFSSLGAEALSTLQRVRNRFWLTKFAVVGFAASVAGALVTIKALGEYASKSKGLVNLGVTPDYIKGINAELGNTLDKTTLINQVQTSVGQGTDLSLLQDAAKAAAHLAKQFGYTKEEMFAAVSAGELQEGILQRLGVSQKALNNKVAAMSISLGLGTGELDEATKRNLRIKAIIEATRKQTNGWKGDTAQVGDEAARTLASLKDAVKELAVKLLPYSLKLVKGATSLVKLLEGVSKEYREHKQELKDIYNWSTQWLNSIVKQSAILQGVGVILGKVRQQFEMALAKRKAKTLENEDATHNILVQKQVANEIKRLKAIEAQQSLAAKERQRLVLARQKRIAEERKRQAQADARALQDQALDLVRNFSEKIVQTVADAGGSFGTIASALTDIFEKGRMFASQGFGLKAIDIVAKTLKETGGETNKDLIRQVELRARAEGATRKTAQAAQLLAGWIRGGADDTAEFLQNEKAANAQLRAGLSTLQAQAKIASLRVEQANLFKDVTQFAKNAETTINALNQERNRLLKVGNDAARAKASIHSIIIQRLEKTKSQFVQIAAERKRILGIAQQHAKIERDLEITLAKQQRSNELRSAKQSVQGAKQRLAGLTGKDTTTANIKAQAQQQIAALQSEIGKMLSLAKAEARKLTAGGGSDAEQVQRLEQINHLQSVIALKRKEIDLIHQARDAEIHRFTLAGQMQQQFGITQNEFIASTVAKMKEQFSSFVGGFADTMTDLIVNIGKGDAALGENFGKSTLEALGNLSTQWGSFLILQGTGMMATGSPLGGVSLGAGIGLTALGIGLRATSGLMAPSASKPANAGAAANPQFDRIPGTEPKATGNIRETFILVNNVPWRKNDARDFVDMVHYAQHGERMTGLKLSGV